MYMFVSPERTSMSRTVVLIMFPPVVDVDGKGIESRELTVLVKGESVPIVKKFTPLDPSTQITVPTGTVLDISLVDIDASKNRSLPVNRQSLPWFLTPHLRLSLENWL